MSAAEDARRWCAEFGGPEVDDAELISRAVTRAEATGRPLKEAVHDVVSGWLVTRAQAGDRGAHHQLLRMWRGVVLRWCRWNCASGVDPEDAAHDVLVRAMQRLDRVTRPDGFRAWLWAIAWRVLRESEKRPSRWRWVFGRDADQEPARAPRQDDSLLGQERHTEIRAVLQALPQRSRMLLWHAYVDNRSRADIAALTGWSLGTVNRRLTQARQHFRTEAERRGLAPLPQTS